MTSTKRFNELVKKLFWNRTYAGKLSHYRSSTEVWLGMAIPPTTLCSFKFRVLISPLLSDWYDTKRVCAHQTWSKFGVSTVDTIQHAFQMQATDCFHTSRKVPESSPALTVPVASYGQICPCFSLGACPELSPLASPVKNNTQNGSFSQYSDRFATAKVFDRGAPAQRLQPPSRYE